MDNDLTSPNSQRDVAPRLSPMDEERLLTFGTKLQLIRDRVRGVAEKYHTACYVVGRPGVSKTFTAREELDRLGVPWIVRNARMTPMGLFEMIAEHPEHVIVLDDIGTLFKQEQSLQILLAALDGEPTQARTVTYKSKDRDVRVQFMGGIVAISNVPLRNDPLARALGSRIVVLEHEPTDEEIAAFMRHLALKGYKGLGVADCQEVVEFLIAESRELDQRLDLRHFHKALEDYRQDKDGNSDTPWEALVRSSLRKLVSQPMLLTKKEEIEVQRRRVKELMEKYPDDTVRQLAESGLGKSTFYQRRRELLAGAAA